MGLRQSAPIKQTNIAQTRQISLKDFKLLTPLEKVNKGLIYNWIVDHEGQLLVMKIIPKIHLYNTKKIKSYIRQLFQMVSLPHQFLLQPYYAFQDFCNLYLVVEYVQGGDLRGQMKFFINEDDAKHFTACLFIVINYLHQNNVIHTNINPSNILIDLDGYPKLYGLHCSCQSGDMHIEDEITEYMAPEVVLREDFGFEADYYSIGIILYEIMAQKKLLQDETLLEFILQKQIQVKKSDLSEGWSLDAADFINKLIQKNPSNRLGYYGFYDIKKHNWFQGVQWQKLEEKAITMPIIGKYIKEAAQEQSLNYENMMLHKSEFQNLFRGQRNRLYINIMNMNIITDFIKEKGDPFQILNIEPTFDKKVVKQAYKDQALLNHPDKSGGSQKKFIRVKEAYDFITKNMEALKQYEEAKKHRSAQIKQQSQEGQYFTNDLERREKMAEKDRLQKEEIRKMKINEEINRMKREQQQEEDRKKRIEQKKIQFELQNKDSYKKLNSIKVKWPKDSFFTSELLNIIFKKYGPIKEITITEEERKAEIWYHTTEAANNAISNSDDGALKVKFRMKAEKRKKLQDHLRQAKENLNKTDDEVLTLNSDTLGRIHNFYNKEAVIQDQMDILRREQERQKMMDQIYQEELNK